MAKIIRATQTLFGGTGVTSDFGEFGSLAAGTPTTTKTPSVIQSLAAWGLGWAAATIGVFVPAYQDMNAVHYLAFYQICYLLQMGVAEYDAGTTYYTNSVAQYNGQFYVSLVDNNAGNEPDISPSQWQSGLPGAEITGVIKQYAGVTAPAGYLLCNGAAVNRTTYAALFSIVGTLYGIGDGSTTFNIPDLRGRVAVGYLSGDSYFGTLGESGGEETHTLTTNEMPSHSHTVIRDMGGSAGAGAGPAWTNGSTTGPSTNPTGGGEAHNNLQPYLTVNHIIKY
jgi:microcystin-dependent protein